MMLAGDQTEKIVIQIGVTALVLRTADQKLAKMLRRRYSGFVTNADNVKGAFEIERRDPGQINSEEEVAVR